VNQGLSVGGNLGQTGGTVTVGANVNVGSVTVGPGTMTVSGGNLTVTGAASIDSGGTLTFTGTRSMSAASLNLASGGTLGVTISGGNSVSLLTVPGAVTLAGSLNVTGNPSNVSSQSLRIVNSTTGPLDVSGLSLGTTPAGFAFGAHVQAGTSSSTSPRTRSPWTRCLDERHLRVRDRELAAHGGASANDRLLIVGVSTGDNIASAVPTTVTYGPTTLTVRKAGQRRDDAGPDLDADRASAGNHTMVTLTFPAGSSCFVVAGSVSYTGVNQAASIGAVVSNTETGNTPLLAFVTVPVQRGDKVFAALSSNTATSATPIQSGVTARWSALNGTEYGTAETLPTRGRTTAT
jgi:hypothetical protein